MVVVRNIPLALTALALTVGCTKEVVKEKVVKVPQNIFGMEYKYTPISESSEIEREIGKAVGLVRMAPRGTGTGFFVSEDGLFLTNEHIVTREQCSQEMCKGIQIIRNFAPNGDFEIFSNVKVLAHNKSLDYALLKVDLPDGKTVPYIPLNSEMTGDGAYALDVDLKVIGHPQGGTLRVSEAVFRYVWDDSISIFSTATSGNSGSPLVDVKTGVALGLVSSISWNTHMVKKTGEARQTTNAKQIAKILENLKLAYPDVSLEGELNLGQFEVLAENPRADISDVLPPTRQELLSKPGNFETLVGQAQGTEQERGYATSSIKKALASSTSEMEMGELVSGVGNLNLIREKVITIDQAAMDLFSSYQFKSETTINDKFMSVKIQYGLASGSDCIHEADQNESTFKMVSNLIRKCGSPMSIERGSVLGFLARYDWENGNWKKYQHFLRAAVSAVELHMKKAKVYQSDRDDALRILESVVKNADTTSLAFKAESLHAMIQRDFKLIGADGWKKAL